VKRELSVVVIVLAAAGCRSAGGPSPGPAPADCSGVAAHELLNAVLWMQRSAEYRANTLQAFATAMANIDRALADPLWQDAVPGAAVPRPAKAAVVVDADETILDNSPTEAAQITAGRRSFDREAWATWEARGEARPLEGALEFLAHARQRDVTVFFVTNRRNEEGLRRNLAALGVALPDVPDVVRVRGECDGSGDKLCRRLEIACDYRVLLIVGDDLGDFLSVGELSAAERLAAVRDAAHRWGRQWIVLPNPAYGSWERALLPANADDCTILRSKLGALEGS
jgi:acid phosphatase